jgi:antirestriction protein
MFFLMDNNIVKSFEDAKDKIDEVCITESSLLDAATELFDECYLTEIPKESRDFIGRYIDYEAFARDCEIGGDMREFEFGGKTYTCTNANVI